MPETLQRTHTRTIRLGHTPDMDDAFMFYAMARHLVPMNGFKFEHIIEDIQALNRRALSAELDVTAISAASYPALSKNYWILSVGSSVGEGYGPLVLSKPSLGPASLEGRRIAVPGLQTTAFMLLQLAVSNCSPVEMSFDQIPKAVLEGQVDAGLVIHEWQLIYPDTGLVPVLDLGRWWQQETKLPLPLGLNVVRASLGRGLACQIARILYDSILYAFAHQEEALAYAMHYGRGTDAARSKQFIDMYVNDDTMSLSHSSREALRELFHRAKRAGLIPHQPHLSVIEPTKQV